MAQINNKNLLKGIIDNANIQISRDSIPNQLADKVVPVMEVNTKLLRRCDIVRTASATNATSATIFTTPTDRDFYLVSAQLSTIKDVTATSLLASLFATINGIARAILQINGLTLTIQANVVSISFPFPIKIDRNTIIGVSNSTNVANVSSSGAIVGYIDDDVIT